MRQVFHDPGYERIISMYTKVTVTVILYLDPIIALLVLYYM